MKKAKIISYSYQKSERIRMQGTRKDAQRRMKPGYQIQVEKNGYYVLVKLAGAIITLENEDGDRGTFDMREDVLRYFNGVKLTPGRLTEFVRAVETEKLNVFLENGEYSVK